MDRATNSNMKALIDVGTKVLKQKVAKVNLETGLYKQVPDGQTNDESLKEFAEKLSQERRMRACK
jgi:DNA-binding cell septation regulator SpoVG